MVWVVNADGGDHQALLDLPLPTAQREFYGLVMAPAVALANPTSVGFLGKLLSVTERQSNEAASAKNALFRQALPALSCCHCAT